MSAYLCGPMTDCEDFNYPAFHAAAARLRAAGWEIENPAENTPPQCMTWQGYMRIALQQLLTCETIIMLPGWEQSRGAAVELYVAAQLGIKIVYSEPLVQDLHPVRTDTTAYWLRSLLDGVVPAKFLEWLKK